MADSSLRSAPDPHLSADSNEYLIGRLQMSLNVSEMKLKPSHGSRLRSGRSEDAWHPHKYPLLYELS